MYVHCKADGTSGTGCSGEPFAASLDQGEVCLKSARQDAYLSALRPAFRIESSDVAAPVEAHRSKEFPNTQYTTNPEIRQPMRIALGRAISRKWLSVAPLRHTENRLRVAISDT